MFRNHKKNTLLKDTLAYLILPYQLFSTPTLPYPSDCLTLLYPHPHPFLSYHLTMPSFTLPQPTAPHPTLPYLTFPPPAIPVYRGIRVIFFKNNLTLADRNSENVRVIQRKMCFIKGLLFSSEVVVGNHFRPH